MHSVKIKSVHSVKHLGITVAPNFKCSQQCNESVNKKNRMTRLIKRKFSFKNKDVVPPLNIIGLSDLIWSVPCSFGLPTTEKEN